LLLIINASAEMIIAVSCSLMKDIMVNIDYGVSLALWLLLFGGDVDFSKM